MDRSQVIKNRRSEVFFSFCIGHFPPGLICGDDLRSKLFHSVAVRIGNEFKAIVNFRQAEFNRNLG